MLAGKTIDKARKKGNLVAFFFFQLYCAGMTVLDDPQQRNSLSETNACLKASERMCHALSRLVDEIERTGDPTVEPPNPLPVDKFIKGMNTRKNSPVLKFKPVRLRDELWTESLTGIIYAGIEQAFVRAGMMPGGNAPGYVQELEKWLALVDRLIQDPSEKVPDYFAAQISRRFTSGFIPDRRKARIQTVIAIGSSNPPEKSDLLQLRRWLIEDLAADELHKKGRPFEYQKIVFAAEIANLWNKLTERPMTRGPDTKFAQFLSACWRSGKVERHHDPSFKIVLRHRIGEHVASESCGKCTSCKVGTGCSCRSYYGILF